MAPKKAPNGDFNAQKVSLGHFPSKQAKTKKRLLASTLAMMRSLLAAALIVCCTGSVLQSVLPPNGTTITIKAGDTSVIVLPLHDAAGDICKKFSNTVTNPLVISSASAVVHRNETDVNIYPYAVAAGSCAIHVSLIYGSTTIKYEYKFIVTGAVAADTAERALVEGTVLLADEEAVNGDVVYPDVHWNDTDGNRIEAHAAGMLQSDVDHRWYWYGESKKTGDLADHGVNCYSADTIAGPWKNEGQVFHQQDIHMANVSGPFIVERPKVLYNAKTKLYVLWFHLDTGGYKFRHAGIATSTTPTGPFKFVHGLQPDGIPSLDMSLFRDPVDGQAYFVRSCNNAYTGISRLTEDYLDSKGMISNHSVFEGMALFRHENGKNPLNPCWVSRSIGNRPLLTSLFVASSFAGLTSSIALAAVIDTVLHPASLVLVQRVSSIVLILHAVLNRINTACCPQSY
jgi:hypothetical protein